jgi:hypothetical protein
MADVALWASRVEEWRRSGQTTGAFCSGREFSAGGLRYWVHRLRSEGGRVQGPPVRLARVVRQAPVPATVPPSVPSETAVVIEVGMARVAVRSGFDRATLASVLDLLAARTVVS